MSASRLASFEERLGDDNSLTLQPYGICLEDCTDGKKICPVGERCAFLYHTRTGQKLAYRVCAKEVGLGESCVNRNVCKKGLRCIHFPRKNGELRWLCMKSCRQVSDCKEGEICRAREGSSSEKFCQKVVDVGKVCGGGLACPEGAFCVPSEQKEYPARCLKLCHPDKGECASDEVCHRVKGQEFFACYKKARRGEQCLHGFACEGKGLSCLKISENYAICAQLCQTKADCPEEYFCGFLPVSHLKICRRQVPRGAHFLNLAVCRGESRALRFSSQMPPICLVDCSSGDQLAPFYCGLLSSEDLRRFIVIDEKHFVVVGGAGIILLSEDAGRSWHRLKMLHLKDFYAGVFVRAHRSFWTVGERGTILQWRHLRDTWTPVERGTKHFTLRAIAFSAVGDWGLSVGDSGGILRSDDAGQHWVKVSLSFPLSSRLYGVVIDSDLALIVGEKGLLLRSEDKGKSWQKSSLKTAVDLLSIHLFFSSSKKLLVITTRDGGIFLSEDGGKHWKLEQTPFQAALWDVLLEGERLFVVGEKGSLGVRHRGRWVILSQPNENEQLNFRALATVNGRLFIVGERGQLFWSDDGGKHWQHPKSSLLVCAPVFSGISPDGGICLLRCDPKKGGADCPPTLQSCRPYRLGEKELFVCAPSSPLWGEVTRGKPCVPYEGAASSERCARGLSCLPTRDGWTCLQPCLPQSPSSCSSGESCLFSPQLSAWFCGLAADVGEECRLSRHRFCRKNTHCVYNEFLQKSFCRLLDVREEGDFCLADGALNAVCREDLVCVGSAATPFRRFCARRCGQKEGSCPQGWACVPDKSGQKVCVELCPADGKCRIEGLQCRQLFTGDRRRYCI